jgi:hypothetical protein
MEGLVLDPIFNDLLHPDVIAALAKRLQKELAQMDRVGAARARELTQEAADLDARIERLRKRLQAGDPDMTDDELQVAIDRAAAKRQGMLRAQPKADAKLYSLVP